MTQLQRFEQTPSYLPADVPIPLSLQDMERLAVKLVASGCLPITVKKAETALAIMLKGREIGIPPMQAFAHIAIINGKPACSAELQLSLIRRDMPNAKIKFLKNDRDGCSIRAQRPGEEPEIITFDKEDARLAGLLGKEMWSKYPRAMYRSRAISEMARSIFPDAIAGMSHTPEELGAKVVMTAAGDIEVEADPEPRDEAPSAQAPDPMQRVAESRKKPGYDGSTEHQAALQEKLKTRGVPQERWEDIHNAMMGKTSSDLEEVLRSLGL